MTEAALLAQVDTAVRLAATATSGLAAAGSAGRAAALRQVADELDVAKAELVPLAAAETRLAPDRLTGELSRTTFQLRLFAEVLDEGAFHGVIVDHKDESWPMGSRPDLRRCLLPIGPVAVFAASNFPFAFSVAGGDTAAALAAGCPVIVKAHPGHPRLSELTATIVSRALAIRGLPAGAFSIIYGKDAGTDLVMHPLIKAVSFTGSLSGGRALFNMACSRPEPIPFYGELGSINPVFVTETAAATRRDVIVQGFIRSFTMGGGQFCTKPGLLFVPAQAGFEERLAIAVRGVAATPLLNEQVAAKYEQARSELAAQAAVRTLAAGSASGSGASPTLLAVDIEQLLCRPEQLLIECFGPAAMLVTYHDERQLLEAAAALPGQLTATIHGGDNDTLAMPLMKLLADRAGRVLWNSWPTGVSATWAQHHGGPYPATTCPAHTSVGPTAITRFLRPVAFQGIPDRLLPEILRDTELKLRSGRIDGVIQIPGHSR